MRDYVLILLVLGLLPFIFKRPQIGIFTWSWLSYMNPHRMTWSFAYSMPFAQIVALATLVSIFIWKEPKRIPVTGLTVLWALFIVWMGLTSIFAFYPETAFIKLQLVFKIQLVTFLTILVIRTKQDLDILIWVITLSIGFFTIKGGVFTISTLGSFRVWGPPGSFIADNNALAVASFMIVPMMFYLRGQANHPLLRHALVVAILLTVVSAFGSQSRGAFIAAMATGFYFWWNSPNKFFNGVLVISTFVAVLAFMPETWWNRMYTILEYEQDGSAMGRIAAWQLAISVANDQLTGGGFQFWGPDMFRRYSDNPDHWNKTVAAHSIYFTVVGEHGWPGAILFVTVFFLGWRTAARVATQAKEIASLQWLHKLMRLLQVSLISYASGGAFLNLAYFDLPWHILSVIVIGRTILEKYILEETESPVPEPTSKPVPRRGLGVRKPAAVNLSNRIKVARHVA